MPWGTKPGKHLSNLVLARWVYDPAVHRRLVVVPIIFIASFFFPVKTESDFHRKARCGWMTFTDMFQWPLFVSSYGEKLKSFPSKQVKDKCPQADVQWLYEIIPKIMQFIPEGIWIPNSVPTYWIDVEIQFPYLITSPVGIVNILPNFFWFFGVG